MEGVLCQPRGQWEWWEENPCLLVPWSGFCPSHCCGLLPFKVGGIFLCVGEFICLLFFFFFLNIQYSRDKSKKTKRKIILVSHPFKLLQYYNGSFPTGTQHLPHHQFSLSGTCERSRFYDVQIMCERKCILWMFLQPLFSKNHFQNELSGE